MRIKTNKEKCLGCGTCVALTPNTFKMDDDGKASVKNSKGDSEEAILETAKACPVQAIEIEGEEG